MKKISLTLVMIFAMAFAFAQEEKSTAQTLPAVDVKTVEGSVVNTSEFENEGQPIIISFWATWCKPCIKELSAIADVYEDWQDETGVKVIAISIDDSRSIAGVAPTVAGYGWEFEVYTDVNSDFKRAMNVQIPPFTIVLNGEGEIVYTHQGYNEGDEIELYEVISQVANGEEVSH